MFSRIHVFSCPGFSESQSTSPRFRSSLTKLQFKKIQVQIQVYKEPNISAYIRIIFYSDNAHMFLIAIAAIA